MVHLVFIGDPPQPHGGDYGSGGSGYPPLPHSVVYGAPNPPHMLQGLKSRLGFSALCLCCDADASITTATIANNISFIGLNMILFHICSFRLLFLNTIIFIILFYALILLH